MFGYIMINKPELKVREYEQYQGYYCGVCQSLKKRQGQLPRLTLSFDMTFMALLLSSLYEPESKGDCRRCLLHPLKKQLHIQNEYTDYAADMNLLLSYYNLVDNWKDDHSYKDKALAEIMKPKIKKLSRQYPRQYSAVSQYIRELSACEKEEQSNIDLAAGLTGRMLGEIYVRQEDLWSGHLRRFAFFLGKFVYLMDAWDDLEKDLAAGSYNPWKYYPDETREQQANSILNMMMSECSLAFEQLPIVENTGILRNVLYSGVWTRMEQIKESKKE